MTLVVVTTCTNGMTGDLGGGNCTCANDMTGDLGGGNYMYQ